MAERQQKVVKTKEYYAYLRSKRDLLPIEKRLGMVRDPDYKYEYTCDNTKPLIYSVCLYSCIILLLSLVCTTITIPEKDKPLVIEMSFGKPKSEIIDTIEVEDLGIKSKLVSEEIGSTDELNNIEPEPETIVEKTPEEKPQEPETSSYEEYLSSIQPEPIEEQVEEITQGPTQASNASEFISSMTNSLGSAISMNNNQAAAAQGRYGSGDSMEVRLARAGAQTGKIQVSLFWDTYDDIDLHLFYSPNSGRLGDHISFHNRFGRMSGGILDVDMNAQGPRNFKCVENIFWPNNVPHGEFIVKAHFYRSHTNNRQVPIMIRIKIDDQVKVFNGKVILGQYPIMITRFAY